MPALPTHPALLSFLQTSFGCQKKITSS